MLIKENKCQKKTKNKKNEGQPDFSINLLQTVQCEMYKTNCSWYNVSSPFGFLVLWQYQGDRD